MRIQTERLLLRRFRAEDADDLYTYLSDADVVKFEPYEPFAKEACAHEAICRAENPAFIAVEKDGRVIGNLYLGKDEFGGEIGWVFAKDAQGKGYATEAAHALMDYAFKTEGLHRILAMCDPQNVPSWKLCERLGMRREAHHLSNVYFFRDEKGEPIWKDTYVYAILKTEWK